MINPYNKYHTPDTSIGAKSTRDAKKAEKLIKIFAYIATVVVIGFFSLMFVTLFIAIIK